MFICWFICDAGILWVLIKEYLNSTDGPSLPVKIAIPSIVTVLFIFNVYYKSWAQSIERKLIAIATADELGKASLTSAFTAVFLDALGIIVPTTLYATLFLIGGNFLVSVGKMLFICLALYMVPLFGKIIVRINTKEEIRKKEEENRKKMADEVAEKVASRVALQIPANPLKDN